MPVTNALLKRQKKVKDDEYYTYYSDVESEVSRYADDFRGKTVYCPCDDPEKSAFVRFFIDNFKKFGLKRLYATCYKGFVQSTFWHEAENEPAPLLVYDGTKKRIAHLHGDGDFQSEECQLLFRESDIICTNPPFSLFRAFWGACLKNKNKFLLLGPMAAITTNIVIASVIEERNAWWGYYIGPMTFERPDGEPPKSLGNISWYQNFHQIERDYWYQFTSEKQEYQKYDNYDAIDCTSRNIPDNYYGVIGVPVSFASKLNPKQFELVGITSCTSPLRTKAYPKQLQIKSATESEWCDKCQNGPVMELTGELPEGGYYLIEGKPYKSMFRRLLIRRIRTDEQQEKGETK